jgi:hypothetical protein
MLDFPDRLAPLVIPVELTHLTIVEPDLVQLEQNSGLGASFGIAAL